MQKHVNIEWSNSARKYENARRKNTCNRNGQKIKWENM